jgi:hypothetical protein
LRNKAAIFIFCSLALGPLIAGCGGGSSESQIDKAAFVKQADEICKRTSGKLAAEVTAAVQKESAQPGASRTKIQLTLVKGTLIPGLESELEEIRALGIPDEGTTQVQAFFKAIQKMIAKAEADPEAFANQGSPYEGAELAGRRYGISACPISPVSAG